MTNSTFRKIAAFGLVAGPLAFALGDLLRRLVEADSAASAVDVTAAVHDRPGLWLAAALLSVLSPMLLVPGIAGVLLDARGRGGATVAVGSALLGVGAIASLGHATAFYAPFAMYDDAGLPPATIRALDAASESWPMLGVLIALFVVGMVLGPVVLLAGLRRARRVPVWAVLAAVVFAVLGATGGVLAGVLGVVAAGAAFGPVAHAVVRDARVTESKVTVAAPAAT